MLRSGRTELRLLVEVVGSLRPGFGGRRQPDQHLVVRWMVFGLRRPTAFNRRGVHEDGLARCRVGRLDQQQVFFRPESQRLHSLVLINLPCLQLIVIVLHFAVSVHRVPLLLGGARAVKDVRVAQITLEKDAASTLACLLLFRAVLCRQSLVFQKVEKVGVHLGACRVHRKVFLRGTAWVNKRNALVVLVSMDVVRDTMLVARHARLWLAEEVSA